MKVSVRVDGLRALDKALGELPRSLQRGVMLRVLKKAGAPIASAAQGFAPRDTGELAASITVLAKIKNTVGAKEFSDVLRSGGSKSDAVRALRGARRLAKGKAPNAIIYVGPSKAASKHNAIKRIAQEFGTRHHAAHPYMRPAWDSKKSEALRIIATEMRGEIEKTARRLAARNAKKALKV